MLLLCLPHNVKISRVRVIGVFDTDATCSEALNAGNKQNKLDDYIRHINNLESTNIHITLPKKKTTRN